MASNHLILCHPFLLPSIFPSIRVFSSESALRIRWPTVFGASTSAPVLPMSIQDWFPLGLTGLIFLLSKGLSRFFSSTAVWKQCILLVFGLFRPGKNHCSVKYSSLRVHSRFLNYFWKRPVEGTVEWLVPSQRQRLHNLGLCSFRLRSRMLELAENTAVMACVCAQSLSRVRLYSTPWTIARQAPLSMGFSRQEYWSG